MTEESSDQLSWKIPWKDVIASAVPLFTVLGMAFYALSNYAYGHFYSSLGTTPADVGLTYVGILAVSTGWAIALALGLAVVIAAVFAWLPAIRLGGMVGEHLRMGELFVIPYRHAWPILRSMIREREWRLPKEEQEARWNAREAQLDASWSENRRGVTGFFIPRLSLGPNLDNSGPMAYSVDGSFV